MTGSCDAGFPIRLESMVCINQKFCSYEPEIFPGLVFRMFNPKVRTTPSPHAHQTSSSPSSSSRRLQRLLAMVCVW